MSDPSGLICPNQIFNLFLLGLLTIGIIVLAPEVLPFLGDGLLDLAADGAGDALADGAADGAGDIFGDAAGDGAGNDSVGSCCDDGVYSDGQTYYRGVNEDHPGYQDATEGNAYPRGGDSGPAAHNYGFTDSGYTSWTSNPSVAIQYATNGESGAGAVLSNNFTADQLVVSPDIYGESEVLAEGPVTGASVQFVP